MLDQLRSTSSEAQVGMQVSGFEQVVAVTEKIETIASTAGGNAPALIKPYALGFQALRALMALAPQFVSFNDKQQAESEQLCQQLALKLDALSAAGEAFAKVSPDSGIVDRIVSWESALEKLVGRGKGDGSACQCVQTRRLVDHLAKVCQSHVDKTTADTTNRCKWTLPNCACKEKLRESVNG